MKYVQKTLLPDETVQETAKFSMYDNTIALISPFLVIPAAFYFFEFKTFLMISALSISTSFIFIFLDDYTREFAITDKRIIVKQGFLDLNAFSIGNNILEKVEVKQTFTGLIFGFGDIIITGRGSSKHTVRGVSNPLKVKRTLEERIY